LSGLGILQDVDHLVPAVTRQRHDHNVAAHG